MEKEWIVKSSITIRAGAHRVWDLLTNPAETKKYMFGCETVSDWKVGSPLIWKGVFNGEEIVAVKGHIVEIQPDHLLAYTTMDPNQGLPDVPESYLTVTYRLEEDQGVTALVVTQGDFARVADGKKRYQDAYNGGAGWEPILVQIKQLAEMS